MVAVCDLNDKEYRLHPIRNTRWVHEEKGQFIGLKKRVGQEFRRLANTRADRGGEREQKTYGAKYKSEPVIECER